MSESWSIINIDFFSRATTQSARSAVRFYDLPSYHSIHCNPAVGQSRLFSAETRGRETKLSSDYQGFRRSSSESRTRLETDARFVRGAANASGFLSGNQCASV